MTHYCSVSGFELERTEIYKQFLKERQCILENKWYMSERAGVDVGFERALIEWNMKYRSAWRESR